MIYYKKKRFCGIIPITNRYTTIRDKSHVFFNYPSRYSHPFLSYLIDYLLILILVGLIILFNWIEPPSYPFTLVDPWINYPYREPILSNGVLAVLIIVVPVVLLVLSYLWVKDLHDIHHGFLGMAQAALLSAALATFLWWTVGGFRPNFLAVCRVNTAGLEVPTPQKPITYYHWEEICLGNPGRWSGDEFTIRDSLRGFPSAWAALAFATWGFLALYWNGKIKIYDQYAHFWKLFLFFLLLFIALWLATHRYLTYHHNPFQIIVGILIGIFFALVCYRFHFHSYNGHKSHVPAYRTYKFYKPNVIPYALTREAEHVANTNPNTKTKVRV